MEDTSSPILGPVSTEEIGQPLPVFLTEILSSRTFERSPTLSALLLYLWCHRDESLSEYAVATEALGRDKGFDSKIDATVRVQISRLRQRLEKYYQNEGSAVRERILIPVGSHQFELQTIPDDTKEQPSTPSLVVQPAPVRLVRLLLAGCSLLVLTVVVLAVRIVGQETAAQTARPAIPMFWKSFLANGRPTRTILPTPVFFSWSGPSNPRQNLMVRDTDVNFFDGDGATESSLLRELRGRYGTPSLAQDYTVTSDTFAAVRLTRYLDRLGFDTNVMSSASAPLEALDHDNVIAIGTWGTLAPLRLYLDRMSFQLLNHETVVPNRSPGPGEETEYRFHKQSIERSRWPGVIALLPGRDNRTHLLILASHQTSALVSFLTSKEGQDQLERLWRARQSPEYFEIVVEAEMNADVLVRFTARALHRFNP